MGNRQFLCRNVWRMSWSGSYSYPAAAKGLALLVRWRLLWPNPDLPAQEDLEWGWGEAVPCQDSSQDQAQDYRPFPGIVGRL